MRMQSRQGDSNESGENESQMDETSSFEVQSHLDEGDLLPDYGRLEAQDLHENADACVPEERQTPLRSKLLCLSAYFLLNLGLTLFNKAVLGKVRLLERHHSRVKNQRGRQAHFPYLLTTLHASATSIGCFAMVGLGYLRIRNLTNHESLILTSFSFLFTLNIAISNVSLAEASITFHQILRSTCPIVTILIYRLGFGRTYSHKTYLSMIPLVLGWICNSWRLLCHIGWICSYIFVCFSRLVQDGGHQPTGNRDDVANATSTSNLSSCG